MLVKYRGLTLIGGFAMVAIAVGATAFESSASTSRRRCRSRKANASCRCSIRRRTLETVRVDMLHDFARWREELTSVDDLAAFRTVQQVLASPYATPEPVKLAEMTASGFAVARTPALRGRHLLPEDEQPGASPVVVVGYQAWHTRFAADPHIVGRTITLSGVPHGGRDHACRIWISVRSPFLDSVSRRSAGLRTVQGADHLPLRPACTRRHDRTGASRVDDGCATGTSRSAGNARAVAGNGAPYTRDHVDLLDPGMVVLFRIAQVLTGALVFVVAVNLAILVYAYMVTRFGEIMYARRSGRVDAASSPSSSSKHWRLSTRRRERPGALLSRAELHARSRGRAEACRSDSLRAHPPPWSIALVLAVIAALIMGILPGLKATGRRLNAHLHELSGRSGTRLGALWTTLVVAQVGAAVAVLPAACYMAGICGCSRSTARLRRGEIRGRGAGARGGCCRRRQPCRPSAARDDVTTGSGARGRGRTWSSNPLAASGARIRFEEGVAVTAPAPWDVSRMDVTLDMLDVYGAELAAGRRFVAGDVGAANTVLVNQSFAHWLAGDGNALGVRFRYAETAGQAVENGAWFEIVGIVRDFPSFPSALNLDTPAVVYHPAEVGDVNPAFMSVRFNAAMPAGFSSRLRDRRGDRSGNAAPQRDAPDRFLRPGDVDLALHLLGIGLLTLSVLLLSAAGMYALMSSTVAQRAREIGIRLALGACPRSLLGSFGRALRQLGLGIGVGSLASGLLISAAELSPTLATGLLLAVAAIIPAVGLLAALGPAAELTHPRLGHYDRRSAVGLTWPASSLAIRWHRSPIRRIGGVR